MGYIGLFLFMAVLFGIVVAAAYVGEFVFVLGEWAFTPWPLPKIAAWAFSGFILASSTHFIFVEYRKLPNVSAGVLWKGLALLCAITAVVLGSGIMLDGCGSRGAEWTVVLTDTCRSITVLLGRT